MFASCAPNASIRRAFRAAFPLVTRYEAHEIRHRGHRNYLIFYRVEADRAVVIHVLYGARDYEAILFRCLSGSDDKVVLNPLTVGAWPKDIGLAIFYLRNSKRLNYVQ